MIPGEVRVGEEPLELNADRDRKSLVMVNEGDRPVQVGSHLHLPAANPALGFDRSEAEGYRLDIPSGTSVRFEPGVSRTVEIVALAGRKHVPGLQVREPVSLPSHQREPKPHVPFGTPGTEVEDPQRASGWKVRVSEEPTRDETGETDKTDQSGQSGQSNQAGEETP